MTKHGNASDRPPFSYAVSVGHVSHNPIEVHIEADARELQGLAKLWDVPSVEALSADFKIRRWKRDGVKLVGTVTGKVTQSCIVSLEPVQTEIHEEIDQIFVPEGSTLARIPATDQGELIIDPDGPDLPDTFTGDRLDVGAVAAEFAAMGLEPYPRKPGVEFEPRIADAEAPEDRKPSPFAVLRNLKLDE